MKVLLLGSGGMLARDLVAQVPEAVELIARTHDQLDVTDQAAIRAAVAEVQPELIMNCAAYANVDGAENERDRAFAVNGSAPGIIGRAAVAAGAAGSFRSPQSAIRNPLVVHFSTDYVFSGQSNRPYREDDPAGPTSVYGASKLAGERALAKSGARYLIVRTSWLFGIQGRSFPRTMWQRAIEGRATRVVNDQVGRPTYTVDLARAVWGLLSGKGEGGRENGFLHIANRDEATWYGVAARIFEAAGVPELLAPCTTAEYPTPAKRPAYSVLDTSRHEAQAGGFLPRWEDAVNRFLSELQAEIGSPG